MSSYLPPTTQAPPQGGDKACIILCHLSLFLGVALILPLIIYLVKQNESEIVAAHAKEALNFHLTLLLYAFISVLLTLVLIGFLTMFVVMIMGFVCAIIAAVKAADGGFYRYPLTLRMI